MPPLPAPSLLTPKAADTLLAGLGLFGSCSVLGLLEPVLPVRLFAPPMVASGIIFFAGPSPPHPKGFMLGTLCSATLSVGALAVLSTIVPPAVAQGGAAAALLMWYKTTGTMFPPVVALAGLLTASSMGAASSRTASALSYLAFPWFAGHAWLYGCAWAMSSVRLQARIALSKRQLTTLQDESDESLRAIFDKFDTSGDGALDADELKVALRLALGVELTRADCADLCTAADTNGTGTVDFDEFRAIVRQQIF